MPTAEELKADSSYGADPKLFAVYLGGRAPKCNTELHDVVFVVGTTIEATYKRLLELWFGSPEGLHIDSWMELSVVDKHRVILSKQPTALPEKRLYFVNLGAYAAGQFTELHANAMVVASSEQEVKIRAKSQLLRGQIAVHTDDLFDIDDCVQVTSVDGYAVVLEPTTDDDTLVPHNGYHILPQLVIAAYLQKQNVVG